MNVFCIFCSKHFLDNSTLWDTLQLIDQFHCRPDSNYGNLCEIWINIVTDCVQFIEVDYYNLEVAKFHIILEIQLLYSLQYYIHRLLYIVLVGRQLLL